MKTHFKGMSFKFNTRSSLIKFAYDSLIKSSSRSAQQLLHLKKKVIVLEHVFRNTASFPILTEYKSPPVLLSWQ